MIWITSVRRYDLFSWPFVGRHTEIAIFITQTTIDSIKQNSHALTEWGLDHTPSFTEEISTVENRYKLSLSHHQDNKLYDGRSRIWLNGRTYHLLSGLIRSIWFHTVLPLCVRELIVCIRQVNHINYDIQQQQRMLSTLFVINLAIIQSYLLTSSGSNMFQEEELALKHETNAFALKYVVFR